MRWQRVDARGSDECRLTALRGGWRLDGVADFQHPRGPARLQYQVECDAAWQTTWGAVRGDVGRAPLHITIERDTLGDWTVNRDSAPALRGLLDLDLGFTPATNLFPLHRLALGVGESADAEAAWLDDATWTLKRLPQRYERRDNASYWYMAPSVGYSGLLTVTSAGFVRDYPGLWIAQD